MHAAEKGHAACVELLAEREGDMKTTRGWLGFPPGTTALGVAEKMARTAIASILSGWRTYSLMCKVIQRILAGRSASPASAQTGPVCPRLQDSTEGRASYASSNRTNAPDHGRAVVTIPLGRYRWVPSVWEPCRRNRAGMWLARGGVPGCRDAVGRVIKFWMCNQGM